MKKLPAGMFAVFYMSCISGILCRIYRSWQNDPGKEMSRRENGFNEEKRDYEQDKSRAFRILWKFFELLRQARNGGKLGVTWITLAICG